MLRTLNSLSASPKTTFATSLSWSDLALSTDIHDISLPQRPPSRLQAQPSRMQIHSSSCQEGRLSTRVQIWHLSPWVWWRLHAVYTTISLSVLPLILHFTLIDSSKVRFARTRESYYFGKREKICINEGLLTWSCIHRVLFHSRISRIWYNGGNYVFREEITDSVLHSVDTKIYPRTLKDESVYHQCRLQKDVTWRRTFRNSISQFFLSLLARIHGLCHRFEDGGESRS